MIYKKTTHTLKIHLSVLSLLVLLSLSLAETYSRVKVLLSSHNDLTTILKAGISLDQASSDDPRYIICDLEKNEIANLKQLGLSCSVVIDDLNRYYSQKNDRKFQKQTTVSDTLVTFKYGSNKGFLTYQELIDELDLLAAQYPHLITVKSVIGTSIEGRSLWMVKISDNPNSDESSSEPAVYYDALHHGCEFASLSTLMYYMWWLVQNYGKDPLATYIVDNRELFFVPIVNPDGYSYNGNDSSGGGWRKNRRVNADSTIGVDLNRNYGANWGDSLGSSKNPGAQTYRGTSPFSEPESRAIRDFVLKIKPVIGFSLHTYGQRYLTPGIDYCTNFSIYSEFASEFIPSYHLYGLGKEMVGYRSSGSMRDYLDSMGSVMWVPELGSDDDWFRPPKERIVPIAKGNLIPMYYIAMAAGGFARLKSVALSGTLSPGDTVDVLVGVKNRGLRLPAQNVVVSIVSLSSTTNVVNAQTSLGSIEKRETMFTSASSMKIAISKNTEPGDSISFIVKVFQNNIETDADTFHFMIGEQTTLFTDGAENGSVNWHNSGDSASWDTTSIDSRTGAHCFSDSPMRNTKPNTNSFFTLQHPVDLINARNPFLEFYAKWSINTNRNYTRLMLSTDSGTTWSSVKGNHTVTPVGLNNDTAPCYLNNSHWVKEQISLKAYCGKKILLRFRSVTSSESNGIGDGFYFDDISIVDFASDFTDAKYFVRNPVNSSVGIKNVGETILFDVKDYRNPVSIDITDIIGRSVWSRTNINSKSGKITWNHRNISTGYFTIVIREGMHLYTRNFIKFK